MKPANVIFRMPPDLFPATITTDNYIEVANNYNIFRYFTNSMLLTVISTVIIIFISSLAAYAISRYDFKGKATIMVVVLSSQMVPVVTLLIPLYTFFSGIRLVNSHLSLIIVYSGFFSAISTWLLTSFFESIPKSLDEAATIDGASTMTIFARVILPLAKPGLMAASITIIITVWHELMVSMTFISSERLRTLPVAIMGFIFSPMGTRWGPMNAAGVTAFMPIFIMYCFLQKYLVKGLTSGAVKG
jgi:ABC-type glycerol-3-phosphate transport system permease component